MNVALIKYNLSYYVKTLKFIAPCLTYIVFLFVNYQSASTIWGNYYITAVAIFILSNWIGTSFINSEDKTQQCITRLHIKNETAYHFTKIISILIFMLPFYTLLIFYPIAIDFFMRNITVAEIIISLAIHFLFSLMGTSMSIFFNTDLHNHKNNTLPLQVLIILAVVLPLSLIFNENVFVKYAVYILPPLNFLSEKLYYLHDEIYILDYNFIIFSLYAIGYSSILIAVYILIIKKKNKE